MAVKICFADLTHTGQVVATNSFPLGIAYVAAYAGQELGGEIDAEIFKYPDDFSRYLESNTPTIAAFSSFCWNIELGHEYARRIKMVSPDTITVFGGPNFPDSRDEQHEFLSKHPAMDCYIEFEGERPFVELVNALKTVDFDWQSFKGRRMTVPNLRYLVESELVSANLGPKTRELDSLASPYLSGRVDKFFDDMLIPLLQTTRGCPYTCTFCWEGGDYFDKTLRFSKDRVSQELHYMADRINNVPDLEITDANFGMFRGDLDTAREIVAIKAEHKHSWPKSILVATAKNHKERTIELVEILGDIMPPKASVQSTDPHILETIRRKNVSQDAIVSLAEAVVKEGGQSESEIILCLEDDSKRAHFQSVCDMLEAQMTFIRMYQFMLLPGAQSSSKVTRAKHEMDTRFRVLPRCFGNYTLHGETFPVAEIEEIVVANNTMPYGDYQACRDFDLTVEIFNNDSIFLDLLLFLSRHDVSRSEFIKRAYDQVFSDDGVLADLYKEFREEEKRNLRDSREELSGFTRQDGVIDRYVDGEYGTNELYKYRALAVFHNLDALHEVAFGVARSLLKEQGAYNEQVDRYLNQLCEFSLMRKRDMLDTDQGERRTFNYDFAQLMDSKFAMDPSEVYFPQGVEVEVYHSADQNELISGYLNQYGDSLIGLGRILIRANMNRLYRSARSEHMGLVVEAQEPLLDNIQLHNNLT